MSKRIGLACATLVLLSTISLLVLHAPYGVWNGARLMPSFALARGINYYVLLPHGGPLYTSVYGPMVAIIYLPTTLFPSPNSAVLAGAVITAILCFSAVAYLHFSNLNRKRSAADVLAFLTSGFLICYLEPLIYSCFSIHADGPGLAFGAVACGSLYAGCIRKWRMALPVSALFAILSVFCKQVFIFVPIVLLVWVLAVQERKVAVRYLLYLISAGVLTSLAAIVAWGFEPLYHCLVWVPAHYPWNSDSRMESWIRSVRQFIRNSLPVLILVLAGAVYSSLGGHFRAGKWRALMMSRCVPLLLAGTALIPISILSNAKAGGDVNSFSFALFFLTCGVTMMLADLWHGSEAVAIRAFSLSVLFATAFSLAAYEAPLAYYIRSDLKGLSKTDQQVAYAYLVRYPGKAYFPWFPLSHLYAEGQFRHFIWGLVDRWMAGETVSREEFRAYIPRDPQVIVFKESGAGPVVMKQDLMKNLSEYSRSGSDPELQGWLEYGKMPE